MDAAARRILPGFDFTGHMRRLCVDVVERLPALAHVDMSRVAVSFCQTRKNVSWGMWAKLTPLRFQDGALTTRRRRQTWTVQRVYDTSGREMLYILSFYLPRFMQQSLAEKLTTVVHELWHISPRFDGDLRRHAGRCFAHGSSQREYDAQMRVLVDEWLACNPPRSLFDFLDRDFDTLHREHGGIYGTRIPIPKLLPVRAIGA